MAEKKGPGRWSKANMPSVSKMPKGEKKTRIIQAKTMPNSGRLDKPMDWWNATNQTELARNMLSTATYLKNQNQYRYRQASLYAHLYGNMPLFGGAGTNLSRIAMKTMLPMNRPTMSVVTSIVDTIVSRMELNRPRPDFLTDGGDYKQRQFSRDMNGFIGGEFYQTKYYDLRQTIRRDSCIWGTGVIKVLEDLRRRVSLERRLCTQILVDSNEAFLGAPRQLFELALIDRSVLIEMFPKQEALLMKTQNSYYEQNSQNTETASDLIMVVEGFHLPSGPDATDGVHCIACSDGRLEAEKWTRDTFPYIFTHYSPPQVGFWGQGVAERQMGNQSAINQLLMTIHDSINLVGVPRVFLEVGSKVAKAHINNEVGAIVEYEGTKPSYEVAPCVPVELYQQVQNTIDRAYQEEGVSQLAAASEKPAGLNSGTALREYDGVQSDRLASIERRDEQMAIDCAYQITWEARRIALRDGKYQTVFPDKKSGTRTIDLPNSKMLDDPFVIQCFDTSSLPKDPSGRLEAITERVQAGVYSPQEGRRLMGLPDTEQIDNLLNAGEERIFWQLDKIVFEGKFTPPDPFTDLALADTFVTQYYNYYVIRKLEPKRAAMLRKYSTQVKYLKAQALPPPAIVPQANPQPAPTSPLVQNVPGPQQ